LTREPDLIKLACEAKINIVKAVKNNNKYSFGIDVK
jgi:hypothetical protein